MKQLIQDISNGTTKIIEAPCPKIEANSLIIDSKLSLISSGTERMLVDFGKANLVNKALQQPERIQMVIEKIKTDGLATTLESVNSKLNEPIPLGYSNVGVVSEVGSGVVGFKRGDRIISNGPHSEVVRVSSNLCAHIPDEVSDEEASFTVVASIGLQGLRLANPTLGEAFVVIGVGLIGLLIIQLLRSNGCKVLAIDYDEKKLSIASSYGASICNPGKGEDPISIANSFSKNKGVDGVIIAASTKSSDPVAQAAKMCRKQGRIILVGVTGLNLNRSDFYEKEIEFKVSCSYGPGRYDPDYEVKGNDYPFGYVRWTQQRNFEAILDMMASKKIDVAKLISHKYLFEDAAKAYEALLSKSFVLGILLEYKSEPANRHKETIIINKKHNLDTSEPVVGFIGAGNYASRKLIPAFKANRAELSTLATSGGLSGAIHGQKNKFFKTTTNLDEIFKSEEINTVVIATRHNLHAKLVVDSIRAHKNVFVEKPLALTFADIDSIKKTLAEIKLDTAPRLMVGFNRRFAPQVKKMKSLIEKTKEPKSFIITINAGALSPDHWTHDIEIGGGRIIGEACHFIDLMRYLSGSKIIYAQSRSMGNTDVNNITEDKAVITLGFADGSFGSINYLSNGANNFPKERVEVFVEGKVLQLDNFRKLKGFGWKSFNHLDLILQNKGLLECSKAFLDSIRFGKASPIPLNELIEVAETTITVAEQIRQQK